MSHKPYPEFKQLDLAAIANDVLLKWDNEQTFDASITSRQGAKAYNFYEGPQVPTACPAFTTLWHVPLKIFFAVLKRCRAIR